MEDKNRIYDICVKYFEEAVQEKKLTKSARIHGLWNSTIDELKNILGVDDDDLPTLIGDAKNRGMISDEQHQRILQLNRIKEVEDKFVSRKNEM